MEPALGIYVHIPFCVRKCYYCDFNAGPAGEEAREQYVAALCGEIRGSQGWVNLSPQPWLYPLSLAAARAKARAENTPRSGEGEFGLTDPFPPPRFGEGGQGGEVNPSLRSAVPSAARTCYFGGGTPSELSGRQLRMIVAALREVFVFTLDAEWTLEANPGTVTPASLAEMRAMGFNRVSMGVQSFHDHHLEALGRIHNAGQAEEAFRWAGEAGFASRSIDLIFGLPRQTMVEWQADVRRATELRPEHISLYGLTIEAGTEFGRRAAAGQLPLPEEDLAAEMYEYTMDALAEAGYEQYEISNWALPGHRSRHNPIYWRNEPYLGFGVSAASYWGGVRWTNVANARIYAERAAAGRSCRGQEERLTGARAAGEAMMLALRMRDGVDLEALSARHSLDLRGHFNGSLTRMTEDGLLEERDGRLRLTRQGLLLSNTVFCELV